MPRIIAAFTQFFDGEGSPLISGKLKFTVSGTNATDKSTFADVTETIANTNPVLLDSEGRAPSIFGTGSYRATLFTSDDQQIAQFDPVPGGLTSAGDFGSWGGAAIYSIGNIVTGDDGVYYRSITNNNEGNNPDGGASPASWEVLKFVQLYNENVSYVVGNLMVFTDGAIYRCVDGTVAGETPVTDPDKWDFTGKLSSDLSPQMNGALDCNENTFNSSSFRQIADTSLGTGTHTFDFSDGDREQLTATGDITIAFDNFPVGKECTFRIDAINWGDWTITLPGGMIGAGSAFPEFTSSGTDMLIVEKDKDEVYGIYVIGPDVGVMA